MTRPHCTVLLLLGLVVAFGGPFLARAAADDESPSTSRVLAPFFGADSRRSLIQLLLSAGPFVGFWILAYWALDVSYWLTLLLTLGATGFLMRLFMIQHDCGHGSFFKSRRARNALGFVIGASCTSNTS